MYDVYLIFEFRKKASKKYVGQQGRRAKKKTKAR